MSAAMYRDEETAFLNLFRGLAALWVAVAHCFIWGGVALPLIADPKKAVDLFMVISGFLMVYQSDRRGLAPSWQTWKRFYIRRYFRIAPAYYVALAAMVILWPIIAPAMDNLQHLNFANWSRDHVYGPSFQDFRPLSLFLHATFLFGLFPSYSFSTNLPDWSLSLEMQFYAVFPLIYMASRRFSVWKVAVALVAGSVVLTRAYWFGGAHHLWPYYEEPSLLVLKLPMFLVGMLIYEARRRRWLLGLALLIFAVQSREYGLSALSLLAVLLLFTACWMRGIWAQRLTRSRVVSFLSGTSYSLYLTHIFAIALVGAPLAVMLHRWHYTLLSGVVTMVVSVIPLSYLAAWVMYRAVERPGTEAGKRASATSSPIAAPMT
jgi:peptidoglycan/LPS O-acetylase OafA/YrhL